jgi:hypothetical protein
MGMPDAGFGTLGRVGVSNASQEPTQLIHFLLNFFKTTIFDEKNVR